MELYLLSISREDYLDFNNFYKNAVRMPCDYGYAQKVRATLANVTTLIVMQIV